MEKIFLKKPLQNLNKPINTMVHQISTFEL